MKYFCIGVLAGSLLSLFLPIVPPFSALFLLLPVTILLLVFRYLFCAGLLAFICCWIIQFDAYHSAQQQLLQHSGQLHGVIVGIPRQYSEFSQFTLQLENSTAKGYKIRLNWTQPPLPLTAGQRWQLDVRLKPVTGAANPAGFNREAQALLQRVIAQGSVQTVSEPVLLQQHIALRQYLIERIQQVIAALDTAPLLLALSVGEQEYSPQLWQGLQNSGLAHLLAISGLHISLVFGWGIYLLRAVPFPLRWQAGRQPVIWLGALALALSYAWLAGFAIPTIRAAFALLLLVLAMLQYRRLSYSHYWLVLTASLLLYQPFFLLSKSFWLSVLAVAVIFFVLWSDGHKETGWRGKAALFMRFHLSLTLFMSVLSLLMFDGSSLLTLLSNLIFVPWCTVVVIPVMFISLAAGLLMLPGSDWLWWLTDLLLQPLLLWLLWCSELQAWWTVPDLHWLLVCCLFLPALLLLLSRQRLYLYLAVVLLLPACLVLLRPVQWQLHLIDVGQGLAVLLQHGDRGLLYDAGPRYGNYSATAAQVLPYLRQRGVRQLDYLILSHDDSDHTGDWQLLAAQYSDVQIYSDIAHISRAKPCQAIPQQYLAATLQMLDAGPGFSSKNDSSCVLLITLYDWQILLPGDIGSQVEQQLIARYPQLTADVLVLSHHGSNSSSHFTFLHQLAPQLALNSASLYNRHRHPAVAVQQRLEMFGIPLYNTAHSGAIRLDIDAQALQLSQYRRQRIPYWLQKPVGNAETLLTTR